VFPDSIHSPFFLDNGEITSSPFQHSKCRTTNYRTLLLMLMRSSFHQPRDVSCAFCLKHRREETEYLLFRCCWISLLGREANAHNSCLALGSSTLFCIKQHYCCNTDYFLSTTFTRDSSNMVLATSVKRENEGCKSNDWRSRDRMASFTTPICVDREDRLIEK
jgi:hypothetical protein